MHLNQLESALLSLSKNVARKFSLAVHTDEGSIAINADTPRKAQIILQIRLAAIIHPFKGNLRISNHR